jgi:hypothetical protein
MERFSPTVLRVLRASGWHEGRCVETREAEAFLRRWGFAVSESAGDALREFLGLECRAEDTGSWLRFDLPAAIGCMIPERVPALGQITGEPLCLIGCGNGGFWLVSPSGEVVWLHDEWIGHVRAGPLPLALDTHFRAAYDPGAWVEFEDDYWRRAVERAAGA